MTLPPAGGAAVLHQLAGSFSGHFLEGALSFMEPTKSIQTLAHLFKALCTG